MIFYINGVVLKLLNKIVVECKHKHILNIARCLLFHTPLSKYLLSYVFSHAIFLINRLSTPVLNGKSPFFFDLMVFGSLYFAFTLTHNRGKLGPRSTKCIFLRYRPDMKGYIVLDIYTRHIFVSINVLFHEHFFFYFQHIIHLFQQISLSYCFYEYY